MWRHFSRRFRSRTVGRQHPVHTETAVAVRYPGTAFREVEQFEPRRLLTVPAAPLISLDAFGFGSVTGDISSPGETDVFRYEAPEDAVIRIDQFANGSFLDSFLEVQDENCDFLTANDDGPFGLDSQVILEVAAGDVLHLVAGAFGSSTGAYALTITPIEDDFGDSIFDAGFLFLGDEGFGLTSGVFETEFDSDVLQIVSPLTGTLTIRQDETDGQVDSFLIVRNEFGNVIAFNDDFGESFDSQVTVSVDAGDVLYIEATELFGDTGTYQINVSGDFGDDDFNATPLTFDGGRAFVFGEAQGFDDVDVFSLIAPNDSTVSIDLREDDGFFDAFLTVRNEFGQVIAQNDDADFSTFDSRVVLNVSSGEELFIEATELFGFPGFYTLDVRLAADPQQTLTLDDGDSVSVTDAIAEAFEVDLFQLDVTAAGQVTIDLTGIDDILDPVLRVLDADGFLLFENDDFGESLNSRLEFPVSAGDSLLVEAAGFSSSTGDYELLIGLNAAAPDDFPNSVVDASPLVLDEDGSASVRGDIETAFDVDVFRVDIPDDGVLTIQQTGVEGILDPFLFVLDENGFERDFNDDFGGSLNSQIDLPVQAGETVFIEAAAFSSSTGLYDLQITLGDGATGVPGDDFPNFIGNATPLTLDADGNATLSGVIERAFDVDVVSVVAQRDGILTIRQGSPDGFLDPFLTVFDANGSELAQNDDSGSSLDSELSLPVTAGQTIFIESGAFSDSTGSYILTVLSGDPIVDDFGNSDAAATTLTLGPDDAVQQFGSIEVFGDRDVFAVEFPADGTVSVAVTADDDFFLDSLVRIRNASGDQIAFDDDGGLGLNSLARVPVSAGDTIFIDVGTFADASTGTYSLDVMLDQGLVITDDFVNTIAGATAGSPQNLTVSGPAVSQPGSIELPGDVDVFRVDIDAGVANDSALQIRQTAQGLNTFGFTLDTFVRVFNSDGDQIAFNDDDGLSLNSEVSVTVSGGDTIFVQAGAFGQSSGGYNLDLTLIADDFSDTIEQVDANPQLLTTLSGSIERSGDVDVFQLDPSLSGRIEIRQRGTGLDPADSLLQIFRRVGNDGSVEFVTLNDDSEGTLDSRVLIDVKANETYFVFASAFGLTTGDYQLEVSSLTADDVGDTFASGTVLDIAGVDVVTQQAEINFVGDIDIFEFTSDRDGSATIEVASTGSGFDGSVSVFREEDEALVRIASEEGNGSGADLVDSFDLTAGTTYFVRIDGLGTVGTYDVTLTPNDQPLASDGKIPEEVFESVAERLRELFASGADFDALVDGAVEEFLAAMGGDLGGDEFFVFVADPVDFVLADSQSRRVGFTADQGRVNEVQGARLSQDAPVEVLILPTTDRQFPVQLQGVGSNFQIGGRIVNQAGAINGTLTTSTGEAASGAGTLSKDDGNVALVFDFTDQQQTNQFPQNTASTGTPDRSLASATDADASQFRTVPGDQIALAAESVQALQDLRDAYDGREYGDDTREDLLRWLIDSLKTSDQPSLRSLAESLEDLVDFWRDDRTDDDSDEPRVTGQDVFWSVFGGGVMNHLWELGEQIIEQTADPNAAEPDPVESAPSDEGGNETPRGETQEPDAADAPRETSPEGGEESTDASTAGGPWAEQALIAQADGNEPVWSRRGQ